MSKQVYFDSKSLNPELIKLYSKRLGSVERILDLGCGTGGVGKYFKESDTKVTGLEIDIHALKRAKEHEVVVRHDLNYGTLPFKNGVFDGIIAKDILEHLHHPSKIVEEMYRVLRPDGRIVVSVPMAKPHVVWNDYTHIRGFTRSALSTMVEDSGFKTIEISPMGGIPGAGRFNLVHFLPYLLRLPIVRRYAVSHELTAKKPE